MVWRNTENQKYSGLDYWLSAFGTQCMLLGTARGVRYAQSLLIHYFIDIIISQNSLIDIFKKVFINIYIFSNPLIVVSAIACVTVLACF